MSERGRVSNEIFASSSRPNFTGDKKPLDVDDHSSAQTAKSTSGGVINYALGGDSATFTPEEYLDGTISSRIDQPTSDSPMAVDGQSELEKRPRPPYTVDERLIPLGGISNLQLTDRDRESCIDDYEIAVEEYNRFLEGPAKQAKTQLTRVNPDRRYIRVLTALTDAILSLCDVVDDSNPFPEEALSLFITLPKEFKNRRNSITLSCMLHYLVRLNMLDEIRVVLGSEGVDVNARDGTMATPLILVAKLGRDLRIADFLLSSGASVALFDDNNMTAAHYAAQQGSDALLRKLSAPSSSSKPEGHSNPIHLACQGGHQHTVEQLIEGGADKNSIDSNGDTPLMIACRHRHTEIIAYLLSLAVETETVNRAGESALTLSRGAPRAIPNAPWWQAVCSSSFSKLLVAIEGNDVAEISRLVFLGVDVNFTEGGRIPLLWAARHSSVETLQLLIANQAQVNAVDRDGVSALLICASLGKTDCLKALLGAGAYLSARNAAGNTALHLSAAGGHSEALKCLLEAVWGPVISNDVRFPFLDAGNGNGFTALEFAVNGGHKDCVDLLVSCGAKPTARELLQQQVVEADEGIKKYNVKKEPASEPMDTGDSDGKPPAATLIKSMLQRREAECLYHATKHGMTEVVRYCLTQPSFEKAINKLVSERTFVTVKDKPAEVLLEETALYVASSLGHTDIVLELLRRDADPNILAKNGWSCLFVAAKKGYTAIVYALIERGADVRMRNKNDMTPLNIASYGGFMDIVKRLIACGADVNQGDKMGAKPVHAAVQSGKLDVARELLANGADVNGVTLSDISPLYVASYSGHIDLVQLFLDYEPPEMYRPKLSRCNIDIMNKEGLTPLIVAAFNNRLDIVNLLIARGASVNLTEGKKVTALYAASQNGHVQVVERLLQEEVDVNVLIGNGNAAVHGAAIEDRLEVLRLLHMFGAKLDVPNVDKATPLYMACEKGHVDVVNFLIDVGGCDPNCLNRHQVSPMNIASQNGHLEVVRKLIASGGDINSQTEDGPTPLFIASQNGFTEICRVLIEAGAKVDLLTKEKESAIFVAGYFGYLPIVEMLLTAGAQFNIVERDGRTPLWWACKAGRVDVVKLLLSRNADINISDRENVTPLQIATTQRHTEVCELLMSIKTPLTLCAICLTNPRSIVSLPCRHLSFCADCRFKLERSHKRDCPVCRTAITEFMAVYT